MERYLSIVLDELCNVSKTLVKDERYSLDKYILENFKDSNDIRKKFATEINTFLNEKHMLIESIEKRNHKKYNGQIVILEVLNDGSLRRVKVIYKEQLKLIKNTYIKDQDFMRKFINNNGKYFSRYIINKIKRQLSKTDYEYMINEWYRNIKDSHEFFEICRAILKFKETMVKAQKAENKKLECNFPIRNYGICEEDYDPDFDYHPDLDDMAKNDDNLSPNFYYETENISYKDDDISDNSKDVKPKVKRKKMEIPNQLSFFDN